VVQHGQAAAGLGGGGDVPLGVRRHEPNHERQGRVQQGVLQADYAAAPKELPHVLFHQVEAAPTKAGPSSKGTSGLLELRSHRFTEW
jgi:hypothetical protein